MAPTTSDVKTGIMTLRLSVAIGNPDTNIRKIRPSHWQDITDGPNPNLVHVEENLFWNANTYFSGTSEVKQGLFDMFSPLL